MQTEPPKADRLKRKRRWFQFSLRTLMLFTLICAVASAYVVRKMEQKRKERETVVAISKYGGRAFYNWQFDAEDKLIDPQAEPSGPPWWRTLVVNNIACEVTAVDFTRTDVDAKALEYLSGLPRLEKLDLSVNNINFAGLINLQRLTQLQDLRLRTKFTDAVTNDLQRTLPNCRMHRRG